MFLRSVLRKIIMTGIVILAAFIQTAVFPLFSFQIPYPNLMILLTSVFGFIAGKREGMYTGFICGLCMDLSGGTVLGFSALLFMYLGYMNGMIRRFIYEEDIIFPIILVAATDFAYNFIYFVLNFMLRNRLQFGYYFIHTVLPEILFTAVLVLFSYKQFLKLHKRLLRYEEGSET